MIKQSSFEKTITRFQKLESMRSHLYQSGLHLIASDYEVEAYLLILSTWNFAAFRYVMRTFDLRKFRRAIHDLKPHFKKLSNKRFRTAKYDDLSKDIMQIYSELKSLVGPVGASKIMHFKCPSLFVMWDNAIQRKYNKRIRKNYHVRTTSCPPEYYLAFLKQMQRDFYKIRSTKNDRTFAKAVDEYNFVRVHIGKRRAKRESRAAHRLPH